MSRNDQLLVKEYKGKFYVFDVMAESWGKRDEKTGEEVTKSDGSIINELHVNEAKGVFNSREEAHKFAYKYDADDDMFGSEYGVVDDVLFKDGEAVEIKDK